MIQRKQTIYLLLTTILSVLFLSGYFLSFEGDNNLVVKLSFTSIVTFPGDGSITIPVKVLPLTILVLLIPVTAFISIFLYKNRRIQIISTLILMGLCVFLILLSGYYSWTIMSEYNATFKLGLKSFIPPVQLLLSYLAFIGIRNDERLVKSYDRLR